ncbi:hypothetical protein GCM10022406_01790 [Hymenobacter algoricola]|uniref:Cyclic nucleotide-binding domain-containing protein n=1 Tax=Hymenobacter algoricola TaxID=486267 RepID=A0ABP7MAB4_9BACT
MLGVRPGETKTVGWFFLHHFLLGAGTILVYVAANALLLENQPERNLPLAYGVAALAMLGTGRLYAYYEHHWRLQRLAFRTLLATLVLTLVLGLLLLVPGNALVTAVAIMTGYRLIYLLTNLEFWGLSAVVFNVRQSRRLFGLVSAADLPAKALGALLAVFVHEYLDRYFLLIVAFSAFLLALYLQRRTFRAQPVGSPAAPRLRASGGLIRQIVAAGPLALYLGLSLAAIAVVAAEVEYLFFVNVKQQLPTYATMLRYVGSVLAVTYLVATLLKVLVARYRFGQLGIRSTLISLPLAALAGVALFGVLRAAGVGPAGQMTYFCGLYLGLEVMRRALFEPVFLVLFQPLSPLERLQGHTLVKSFYEPLGLGLAGLLLILQAGAGWPPWVALSGVAGFLLLALLLLQGAYQQYLAALKNTLGLRFPAPAPATDSPVPPAPAPCSPGEALRALLHLQRADARTLVQEAEILLRYPESRVRSLTLTIVGDYVAPDLLRHLALHDTDPAMRELASRLAGRHSANDDLLSHPDIIVRKGAIRGRLEVAPTHAPAQAGLAEVVANPDCQRAALELIGFLAPEQQVELITSGLRSRDPAVVRAATLAAAEAPSDLLTGRLIGLLTDKAVRKAAADGLVRLGEAILPMVQQVLVRETDERLLRNLAPVCARLGTPAGRQLLVQLAREANLCSRAAALRALNSLPAEPADAPVFQRLVEEEMCLAQHLLHSMLGGHAELRTALRYELRRAQQRLLGLLLQLYERAPLLEAQRNLAHATGERQATALEILDNLIPRPLYLGLQALLDAGRLSEKVQTFDNLLGPAIQRESIQTMIVSRGTAAFSAWTVGVALRQWHPAPDTVAYLYPHLQTSDLLIQESAAAVLRRLPVQRPAAYDQLLLLYPTLAASPMNDPVADSHISFVERVRMLKSTALFGQTPESVLGTIVPIMHEVDFRPEQEIFAKGTLGTSLFIIYEGEVGIFNKHQLLTTFGKGEFFGELALLDAEPRSASAVALQAVRAFRIDQEDFYDVTEECTEVVRSIMRELCQRLRRQNEKMPQPETEPVAH